MEGLYPILGQKIVSNTNNDCAGRTARYMILFCEDTNKQKGTNRRLNM